MRTTNCAGALVALLCLALGGAAAAATAESAVAGAKVRETFEVGTNVYVRALKVDEATGTLWVGTSAGVSEVELATGKLRNTFSRKDGLANEYVFSIGIDQEGGTVARLRQGFCEYLEHLRHRHRSHRHSYPDGTPDPVGRAGDVPRKRNAVMFENSQNQRKNQASYGAKLCRPGSQQPGG